MCRGTNVPERRCHRRVRRPWDFQRLFEPPSSQHTVMAFRAVRRSRVRRNSFPASYRPLTATEGSSQNADLKTGELLRVLLTSWSKAWENDWEEEQLFLKKNYLFIYLFMAVLGLRFCARVFSSCGERGPLFIAVSGPLTIAASLVAEHRLQTCRLSSCGSRS